MKTKLYQTKLFIGNHYKEIVAFSAGIFVTSAFVAFSDSKYREGLKVKQVTELTDGTNRFLRIIHNNGSSSWLETYPKSE